jgi:hypothetical protein
MDSTLPWDFIDTGIDRTFVREELRKAEHGETTGNCYDMCAGCGLFCPPKGRELTTERATELQEKPAEAPEVHTTYTLRYGKYGDGRYIGHLDTVTLLLRALRASNMRLRLHGKYHPKPRISLTPAPPLGIESMCELAEIEVGDSLNAGADPAEIINTINSHLPRGLKVLEIAEGGLKVHANGHLYVLVSKTGHATEGLPWRSEGEKQFTLWQGQDVKRLWQSALFERIIKVEEKRIHGSGTDH